MAPLDAWRYRRRAAARRDASCAAESGEFRHVRIADADGQGTRFCSNFVRTSKYTVLTFFPLFLRNAFDPRIHSANTFFLVICAMQCVPYITYTAIITICGVELGTPTTLMPLGFVVTVDAIFQARRAASGARRARARPLGRVASRRVGRVVPARGTRRIAGARGPHAPPRGHRGERDGDARRLPADGHRRRRALAGRAGRRRRRRPEPRGRARGRRRRRRRADARGPRRAERRSRERNGRARAGPRATRPTSATSRPSRSTARRT